MSRNGEYEDFTNRKMGLVTVKKRAPPSVHGAVLWFAVCECGKGRWFRSNNLKRYPPRTHKFCRRGIPEENT
jgi:hypothetical protein